MRQVLDQAEVELFSKYIISTGDSRSVYDLVPCDSEIERKFVQDLEARTDVKLYLKLPYWFTMPTPVGENRPDWAIVMEELEGNGRPVLYLIAETKGSLKKDDLRSNEWRRIQCGAAHFGSRQFKRKGALEGVDYRVVTEAAELPSVQA
jgi:type III restriction enzyme